MSHPSIGGKKLPLMKPTENDNTFMGERLLVVVNVGCKDNAGDGGLDSGDDDDGAGGGDGGGVPDDGAGGGDGGGATVNVLATEREVAESVVLVTEREVAEAVVDYEEKMDVWLDVNGDMLDVRDKLRRLQNRFRAQKRVELQRKLLELTENFVKETNREWKRMNDIGMKEWEGNGKGKGKMLQQKSREIKCVVKSFFSQIL